MSTPLLSICIPTYNRAKRLDLLLQLLVEQINKAGLEKQVEIVISDNVSSDGTPKVGDKWSSRHSYVRYFRNKWNIGGEPNFLRAASRGTGTFAWVLGDDDRIRKGGIAKILNYLAKPGVTQLFLNFRCVDPLGRCLIPSRVDPEMPENLTTVEVIKRVGFMSVFALISTHIFNREMLLAVDSADLLRLSPWYVLNTALLVGFHDKPCHIVHEPVLDYTIGNERLPPESAVYSRIIKLLKTLNWLETNGKIDSDFLYGCYETGAGDTLTMHYFREELYGTLVEISGFWALPGREDWHLIREFIRNGPGFWGIRHHLRGFFVDDYNAYRQRKRPIIHFWHAKAWFPAFTLLLSSDDRKECEAFDELMGRWPEEFAHESILISRLSEDRFSFENLDIFMAPFRPHRSPSASLNSGFRKVLGARVLILDQVDAPEMSEVIKRIDDWHVKENAPDACLLFARSSADDSGLPEELLGLYTKRDDLVHRGGFENYFDTWSRTRLLADAGFRLGCEGWAVEGGKISDDVMARWFRAQLPVWLRIVRTIRKGPFSEHGLNITHRHHLIHLRAIAEA